MRKIVGALALASALGLASFFAAEPAFAITKHECDQLGGTFVKGTGGDPNTCTTATKVGKGKSQVTKGSQTSGKGSTKNGKNETCTGVTNPSGSHCKK
jgi:hypothetical protein